MNQILGGIMATQQIEDPVKRKIAEYALITVSIWIMVVGIYFFKFPNNFSFGGVTGFSSVVSRLTGMNASDFTFAVNTGLLVLGFLFLGTDVGIKTVYSSMLMSFSLSALDRFMPMAGTITDQPMLELIFAIFLPAIGSAILFNIQRWYRYHRHDLKSPFQHEHWNGASGGGYHLRGHVVLRIRTDYRLVFFAGPDGKIPGD